MDVGAVWLVARSTVDVVNRYLTVAAGTVGVCLALLVAAPAAHADSVDDAVNQLRSASVYVAPGVTEPHIDVDAVTQAIGSRPIKIAVLPEDEFGSLSKAFSASERIGSTLAPNSPMTVGVVAGRHFNAASSQYCAGAASAVAKDAVESDPDLAKTNDVTRMLQSFVTAFRIFHGNNLRMITQFVYDLNWYTHVRGCRNIIYDQGCFDGISQLQKIIFHLGSR